MKCMTDGHKVRKYGDKNEQTHRGHKYLLEGQLSGHQPGLYGRSPDYFPELQSQVRPHEVVVAPQEFKVAFKVLRRCCSL